MSAMKRSFLTVLFLIVSVFGLASAAVSEQQRTALVIGNAGYAFAPLANPVNDAVAIAKALDSAGFNVILQTDVSRDGMLEALQAFGDRLKADNSIGMFYFAGHGIQIQGENYLLPLGEDFPDEETVRTKSFAVSEAVDLMSSSHDGLNIVVLDACRNNPLTGDSQGLSRIDSSARLFVSYSTSPGAVASDGKGVNSPYTKHLADAIKTPALSLEETFKRTLKGVYQDTSGEQTPWISSSFFGDFMFLAGEGDSAGVRPAQVAASSSIGRVLAESLARNGPARRISGVYRVAGSNPDGSGYSGMLSITPDGRKVHFTWWIGDDVFTGVGEFAGRMLVVNWGDKHPVVYTFEGEKILDGEWADGSATERLTLYSRSAQKSLALREGTYSAKGRNPNGSNYVGTVDISRQGRKFTLIWQIGADSYKGIGALDGNVLTVDWGDTTPVVYALTGNGDLQGLWSGGRGSETLQFVSGR
ncbi:caspase family protein [Roseibium sp. SCP14]|uniref:caspase family protein n=1 Tax=Roseibium sp. SCP14 TaxID=3141375 RepID=UPI0033367581